MARIVRHRGARFAPRIGIVRWIKEKSPNVAAGACSPAREESKDAAEMRFPYAGRFSLNKGKCTKRFTGGIRALARRQCIGRVLTFSLPRRCAMPSEKSKSSGTSGAARGERGNAG
jgi:hypothetical protein